MNVLNSFSLKGKVALVTGGAGLYGKQIVAALAEAGADTYIASRNVNNLEKVAQKERGRGYLVSALHLDLSSDESIEKLYQTIINKSGDPIAPPFELERRLRVGTSSDRPPIPIQMFAQAENLSYFVLYR